MPRKYNPDILPLVADAIAMHSLRVWQEVENPMRIQAAAWYPEAHALATLCPKGMIAGAGIIAALSPQNAWDENVRNTKLVYAKQGAVTLDSFNSNVSGIMLGKVYDIWDGADPLDVLGGDKTLSFYLNIADPQSRAVTVDSHMAKLFGHRPTSVFGVSGVYQTVARGIRDAADVIGIAPPEMQAALWLHRKYTDGMVDMQVDPFEIARNHGTQS